MANQDVAESTALPTVAELTNVTGNPALIISPLGTQWNAQARAWGMTLRVTYPGLWTVALANSSVTWVRIARVYSDRVEVYLSENKTGATRTANIAFTGNTGETATFTVTQAATNAATFMVVPTIPPTTEGDTPAVKVTKVDTKKGITYLEVTKDAVEVELTLSCKAAKPNTRWKAKLLSDWAKLKGIVGEGEDNAPIWDYKYTGTGNASLKLVIPANAGGRVRTTKLTVTPSYDFLEAKTIHITQAANA